MSLKLSRPLSPGWVRRDEHSRYRAPLSEETPLRPLATVKVSSHQTKKRINVVWFKSTDLRTYDHAPLQAARADELPFMCLYIFDPFWFGKTRDFGFPKTGPVRARFLLESVADLAATLQKQGSELCVRRGGSADIFRELLQEFHVAKVFAFHEVCAEELRIQAEVKQALTRNRTATLELHWGFELYHLEDLQFLKRRGHFPKTYSAFRRSVEEASVRPCQGDLSNPGARGTIAATASWMSSEAIPTLEDLGLQDPGPADPRAEVGLWTGGESAALMRVEDYIWRTDTLANHYVGATMTTDPAKSCMRDKSFFKISPWLAHGCISPRHIYHEVKRYEKERRSTKSTGWILHELVWRDFVRFGARHYGSKIFKIGGIGDLHPQWEWSRDVERFMAWKDGRTGIPFIDVFMRELSITGYCNHMGRETSGWFLIADLGLDWRMGAEWFESILIDFEPAANWFNWAYRCLPACVAKSLPPMSRLQTVEALKWCAQHDPDSTYLKRWLPELTPLSATIAREPWRVQLGSITAEEARGRSGGVLDGRMGEIATAVPSAVTVPAVAKSPAAAPPARPGPNIVPDGRFSVSRRDLNEVMALGFHELDAAMALKGSSVTDAVAKLMAQNPQLCGGCGFLKDEGAADPSAWHNWYCYNCWQDWGGMPADGKDEEEDAELQAALKLSMGEAPGVSSADNENDVEAAMLAEAIRLSTLEPSPEEHKETEIAGSKAPAGFDPGSSFGGFVLGRDYPFPLLEPVSLRGSETIAAEAREAQKQRDATIAKTEARMLTRGGYQNRQEGDQGRGKYVPNQEKTRPGKVAESVAEAQNGGAQAEGSGKRCGRWKKSSKLVGA